MTPKIRASQDWVQIFLTIANQTSVSSSVNKDHEPHHVGILERIETLASHDGSFSHSGVLTCLSSAIWKPSPGWWKRAGGGGPSSEGWRESRGCRGQRATSFLSWTPSQTRTPVEVRAGDTKKPHPALGCLALRRSRLFLSGRLPLSRFLPVCEREIRRYRDTQKQRRRQRDIKREGRGERGCMNPCFSSAPIRDLL